MKEYNILLEEAHRMAIALYEDDEAFNLLSDLNKTQQTFLLISLLTIVARRIDNINKSIDHSIKADR